MNVEQSLRALAADDTTAQVPSHVDAAVMAAWDASCRAQHGRGLARRKRVAIGVAIAGAVAASLIAVAVVLKSRPGDELRQAPGEVVRETFASGVPEAVPHTIGLADEVELPSPRRRAQRPSIAPPPIDAAYVLVPDAGMNTPLTIMRVRMPRSAFSRLGVPIANPDGEGMVDVDVLVGEDGVARSIRRATAVGWTDGNR